jgi:hypothetical protein
MSITKLSPGLIEPGTIQTADLAAEVTANINYAMATANFTPPTSAFKTK